MRKIEVYSENRSDSGLLEDLRRKLDKDTDLELVTKDADILIVLGDRPAVLRKALEYVENHKPVAHISGGEKTTGAIDDYIRHAISKLSHFHFTSTEEYRNRVIQLGEQYNTVHWVGEPGLDDISTPKIDFHEEHYIVTYHPTLDDSNIDELFIALKDVNRKIVFTAPNKDKGHELIEKKIQAFRKTKENTEYYVEMGRPKYLAYLKTARAVIGNSSSGIVEAASFGTPCINIGDRQLGRIRGNNVFDVTLDAKNILEAIQKAKRLCVCVNPYKKDGKAIQNIIRILKTADLTNIMRKEFYDIK